MVKWSPTVSPLVARNHIAHPNQLEHTLSFRKFPLIEFVFSIFFCTVAYPASSRTLEEHISTTRSLSKIVPSCKRASRMSSTLSTAVPRSFPNGHRLSPSPPTTSQTGLVNGLPSMSPPVNYLPNSPEGSPIDNVQPLDFSAKTSSSLPPSRSNDQDHQQHEMMQTMLMRHNFTTKNHKNVNNGQNRAKFAEAFCNFTTPSPSPPERGNFAAEESASNHPASNGTRKSSQPSPTSGSVPGSVHSSHPLATQFASAEHMQIALAAAFMQSASVNPLTMNAELMQSLAQAMAAQQQQQCQVSPPDTGKHSFLVNSNSVPQLSAPSPNPTHVAAVDNPLANKLAEAVLRNGLGKVTSATAVVPPQVSPTLQLDTEVFKKSGVFPSASMLSHNPVTPTKQTRNKSSSVGVKVQSTPTSSAIPIDALASQSILNSSNDPQYQEFRSKMLMTKQASSGPGSASGRKRVSGSKSNFSGGVSVMSSDSMHSDDNSNYGGSTSESEITSFHSGTDSLAQSLHQAILSSQSPVTSTSSTHVYSNCTTPTGQSTQESSLLGSSGSRKRGRPLPGHMKDDAYWERRRKNNEAAKRSRDLRRAKEDEVAIRCAYLEQENFKLKCDLMKTQIEFDKLRALWMNSQQGQQTLAAQEIDAN